MKFRGLFPLLILIFVLSLLGCGQSSIKPTETAVASETCGVLVGAEGDVKCQCKGSPEYQPVFFGAVLDCDDLLKVGNEANATVQCNDFTLWRVPPGVSGLNNRCPSAQEAVQIHNGSKIANTRRANEPLISFEIPGTPKIRNTRSADDPFVPYIISPRATHLLDQTPRLRWQAVPGATSYTVRVISSGGVKWETKSSDTEVVYSGEPLEVGESYLLVVESDNGYSSSEEGVPGLGFKRVNEGEAEEVRKLAKQIAEQKLSEEAEALLFAHLYVEHDLIAEAIELLEAQDGSQEAAVYLALGDLYRLLGLNRPAEEHYLKAAPLAEAVGDIVTHAAVQAGLAESYAALGNLKEAIDWFSSARTSYQTIKNAQRTSQLLRRESEVAVRLGETYVVERNMDEAIRWLSHARAVCEALADEQCVRQLDKRLMELSK